MNKNLAVNLILLLVAVIWGIGFIPKKLGMNYMSASAFDAIRFVFDERLGMAGIFEARRSGFLLLVAA